MAFFGRKKRLVEVPFSPAPSNDSAYKFGVGVASAYKSIFGDNSTSRVKKRSRSGAGTRKRSRVSDFYSGAKRRYEENKLRVESGVQDQSVDMPAVRRRRGARKGYMLRRKKRRVRSRARWRPKKRLFKRRVMRKRRSSYKGFLKNVAKVGPLRIMDRYIGGDAASGGFETYTNVNAAWSAAAFTTTWALTASHGGCNYVVNSNALFCKVDIQEMVDTAFGANNVATARKFLVRGWREEIYMQNTEPHDVWIEMYRIKRLRASNTTTLMHLAAGFAELTANAPAGSSSSLISDVHNHIRVNPQFKTYFKILGIKRLQLAPGQCLRKVWKGSKRWVMRGSELLNTAANYIRGEKQILFRFYGCPLPSQRAGPVDQVTFSDVVVKPIVTRTYYVQPLLNTEQPSMSRFNTTNLNTAVLVGTEQTAGPPVYIGAANAVPVEP